MILSTQDIMDYAPVHNHLDWDTISPLVDDARLFMAQHIDPNLIAELETQMSGTPSEIWEQLDKHYSKFLANWSIYKYMPKVYNSISSAGLRTSMSDDSERATKWSYEEQRTAYFNDAYLALETTLSFVHKNCMTIGSSFYAYVRASYRVQFQGIFSDSVDFNGVSTLKINFYTFQKIAPSFSESVDLDLRPIFGAYLDTFIPKSNKNVIESHLFLYMRKVVAAISIQRNISTLVLSLNNDGLNALPIAYDETMRGVTMTQDMKTDLDRDLRTRITEYLTYIKQYVKDNTANLPGIDTIPQYEAITGTTTRPNYANAEVKGSFFL